MEVFLSLPNVSLRRRRLVVFLSHFLFLRPCVCARGACSLAFAYPSPAERHWQLLAPPLLHHCAVVQLILTRLIFVLVRLYYNLLPLSSEPFCAALVVATSPVRPILSLYLWACMCACLQLPLLSLASFFFFFVCVLPSPCRRFRSDFAVALLWPFLWYCACFPLLT